MSVLQLDTTVSPPCRPHHGDRRRRVRPGDGAQPDDGGDDRRHVAGAAAELVADGGHDVPAYECDGGAAPGRHDPRGRRTTQRKVEPGSPAGDAGGDLRPAHEHVAADRADGPPAPVPLDRRAAARREGPDRRWGRPVARSRGARPALDGGLQPAVSVARSATHDRRGARERRVWLQLRRDDPRRRRSRLVVLLRPGAVTTTRTRASATSSCPFPPAPRPA